MALKNTNLRLDKEDIINEHPDWEIVKPLAHDIRNPLNNIMVLTDCLTRIIPSLKSSNPATANKSEIKYLKYLQSIKNEVLKADNILKDYTKIKNNDQPDTTNLKDTLQKIIDDYEHTFSQGVRSYELYYNSEYFEFIIDQAKIIRVIDNLLSNATKFTDKGIIIVEVTDTKDHLHIIFKDSGSGIPADELENIFKPGFRGKKHLRQPGSGLGLFNVEKIISEISGSVEVGSKDKVGSVFKVNIPLDKILSIEKDLNRNLNDKRNLSE